MKSIFTLLSISILFFFFGCVHKISDKGIVLSLTQEDLNLSLNEKLPYQNNFIFGQLSITNAKVILPKTSNTVVAHVYFKVETLIASTQYGSFILEGKPYLNKENKSIYLHQSSIKDFKFAQLQSNDPFFKIFFNASQPLIDKLFKNYPLYTISEGSFNDYFIKDMTRVEDKLLITYGL